jgi:hypothetical protein
MIKVLDSKFKVEEKPGGVFVGDLQSDPVDGLELASLLETAAPVKDAGSDRGGVPPYVRHIVTQFGSVGVFEAMNTKILRAHKVAFGGAWGRAYTSAQMMRYCMEPLIRSESMDGPSMRLPWDWCHFADVEPANEKELLEEIARLDGYSGASAEDHLLARVLANSHFDKDCAGEWVQLRSSISDVPLNIRVPGSARGFNGGRDIKPPILEPKLIWREGKKGKRKPISNAEAGLVTTSHPERLVYQDGTTGLVAAAVTLGANSCWPISYEFDQTALKDKYKLAGRIMMQAPQVPLLAQVSAKTILNHPEFESLLV